MSTRLPSGPHDNASIFAERNGMHDEVVRQRSWRCIGAAIGVLLVAVVASIGMFWLRFANPDWRVWKWTDRAIVVFFLCLIGCTIFIVAMRAAREGD